LLKVDSLQNALNPEALLALESAFQKKWISGYGISSEGFSLEPHEEGFLSVGIFDDWISETGAQGFRKLSAPYNLLEPGALLLGCQEGLSLVEACRKRNWSLELERPFNAKLGAHWFKFTDFESDPDLDSTETLKAALAQALSHETKYKRTEPALNQIGWAHLIRHNFSAFSRPEVWSRIKALDLEAKTIPYLKELSQNGSEYSNWATEYLPLLGQLSQLFTEFTLAQGAHRSRELASFLDGRCEKLHSTPLLGQKTLRILNAALDVNPGRMFIEFQKTYQIGEVAAAFKAEALSADEALQIFESLENFSM
jgi:hypothetical protein